MTNPRQFSNRIRRCAHELGRRGVSALGPLYDLAAPRVFRYALTLTRNRQDAEDTVQAAMVRLALNSKRLAEARHPWAYFLKVVRNEALGIIGRRKPSQLFSDVAAEARLDVTGFGGDDLKETVRLALRKLPTRQAEVVVLKIWEGMTFAEIGEILGQSPNTVASRYRYALRKLTRQLQPLADEVLYD